MASPIAPNAQYERVDQGVDYTQSTPYRAVGSGVVYHVGSGFVGGTGQSVYIRLDKPIVVNGRSYREVYYAETKPLVKVGQRVKEGQPVAGPGAAELGFASGGGPAAPLVGGLGAGTQPSQQGQDFYTFVHGAPPASTAVAAVPAGSPLAVGSPQQAPADAQIPTVVPPAQGAFAPDVELPGTQQYTLGQPVVSDLWRQVNQGSFVSPEALMLGQNAQIGGG